MSEKETGENRQNSSNLWAGGSQKIWDDTADQRLDISPIPEKNFSIFTAHYTGLPQRLTVKKNIHVLDLGCGTGFVSKVFSESNCQVTSLDISSKSIALAKQRSPKSTYLVADMTQVPLPDSFFDLILAITSLEFCSDRTQALLESYRLLKPKGELYVEVRNAGFLPLLLLRPFEKLLRLIGWLKPLPLDAFHDLNDREWRNLFHKAGFVLIQNYPSMRPWNYGSFSTRFKQSLIAAARCFLPLKYHYMVGYRLRKNSSN